MSAWHPLTWVRVYEWVCLFSSLASFLPLVPRTIRSFCYSGMLLTFGSRRSVMIACVIIGERGKKSRERRWMRGYCINAPPPKAQHRGGKYRTATLS